MWSAPVSGVATLYAAQRSSFTPATLIDPTFAYVLPCVSTTLEVVSQPAAPCARVSATRSVCPTATVRLMERLAVALESVREKFDAVPAKAAPDAPVVKSARSACHFTVEGGNGSTMAPLKESDPT